MDSMVPMVVIVTINSSRVNKSRRSMYSVTNFIIDLIVNSKTADGLLYLHGFGLVHCWIFSWQQEYYVPSTKSQSSTNQQCSQLCWSCHLWLIVLCS